MGKRNVSIIVAGLALGGLLLAGSPAAAQMVYAPGPAGWGGNNYNGWSGHTNSGWDGNIVDPRVDRREAYQQQLIHRGIESGSLTPGEARYLEMEQRRIGRAEERMAADGNLSPWERQRLNQMQNQANRDIYRLEHNNRTAMGYEGHRGWDERDRGWWGRDRDWDRRGWDRRDARWQDHNRGWDNNRREYGWQQGHDRDRDRRDYGWHGNNPVGAGHADNHGWQGNGGNSGWHGNNPGGTTPGGTTTGGTTTAGNTQGWQGHHPGSGQPGAYQQPGGQGYARPGQPANYQGQQQYQRPAPPQMRPGQPAPWQGQQYQQARMQAPQPQFNAPRQASGFGGGMVNRAAFSAPRIGGRR